ncbi:helix-turn-helix domain-containing protein [Haploplasma axanthum]|uniref:Transcriptional repressor DicA n=1 Tax=Haploplasma axanthum TaxID=29552 RepID=A0A449BFL7_HAPAX|nr:helix-turn-helix transcriptional regulator [Haploplasma axanthum]VEU81249.1 transcriptional repressor DicA [Haploplasma axanthum]
MNTELFAERLKEYRKTNNLTQEELANILYVSRKTISKWETKRGLPEIYMLDSISKLLNITIDELLKSTGDSKVLISKFNEDKKKYLGCSLIIDLVFIIVFVLSDIPTILNNLLRNISLGILVLNFGFFIIMKILNYYTNAYHNRKKSLTDYYFIYYDVNKNIIAGNIVFGFISFLKVCTYVFAPKNMIERLTILGSVIALIITIIIVATRVKEIIRYVKNRQN